MWLFRYRLLTVLVIGVIMSAISLTALIRIISSTTEQRRERVVDAVAQQVDRLVAAGAVGGPLGKVGRSAALTAPPASSTIGMHGGYLDGRSPVLAGDLPADWSKPLLGIVKQSRERKGRVAYAEPLGSALLVLSAQPTATGEVAWVGLLLPPYFWRFWMTIGVLLAAATALLATTAISAVVTFRRSAAALNRCLLSLAEDLSTPVPRPRVLELVEVADGIRRLAERLAQARREQERLGQELSQKERLAALGRVVAGVAHEVRNPLASIKLRLDLAAVDRSLPPKAELAIAHASSEIARLDRLVADLLVVSGRQMGPRVPTSLGALLRSRIDALSPWAESRGVTLNAYGDGTAVIDAESVARAVDNLLRNAVEASPTGTVVTTEVSATATLCRVCVHDCGPGIASNAELFEPFFTTKPDGTGLGLAISRAIARAHGGEVTYQRREANELGTGPAGTCFELTLARSAPVRTREAA